MTAEEQKTRRRDPEATREAILRAAEILFLDRGMAAVPTSAVAKQAGVTKSLIHHYFGSKDALWESVKKRRFEAYFEAQLNMLSNREGSAELLRESIIAFFRSLQENPEMVRLMSWAQGIFTFQSDAASYVADVHWLFKTHLFLGLTIFLIFPFTRLVHMLSAPIRYLWRPGYQVVRKRQGT